MKKFVIFTETDFDIRCGGLVVQYELAKNLNNLENEVRIISPTNKKNNIYNNFVINKKNINIENTIVIYGEGIKGNPLNAKYVIRWILAPLGLCCNENIYKTWNPNDKVYYFNSENKFIKHPEKLGKEYKLLNILFINPNAINKNIDSNNRYGTCYTLRKSRYHKSLKYIHPPGSIELKSELTQEQLIEQFNKFKYFISYDPLTFITVIAALCGCISIVKKVDNMDKKQWLNQLSISEYIFEKKIDTLYGIAYGSEELPEAIKTIHLAKQQWDDIKEFMINKNIKSFLDDMSNFDNLINNVKNNF